MRSPDDRKYASARRAWSRLENTLASSASGAASTRAAALAASAAQVAASNRLGSTR
jgi:hypothetical protein